MEEVSANELTAAKCTFAVNINLSAVGFARLNWRSARLKGNDAGCDDDLENLQYVQT